MSGYKLPNNTRFAISYTSPENRGNAREGEILQDKYTGEIYVKRVDGATVSDTRIKRNFITELIDVKRLVSKMESSLNSSIKPTSTDYFNAITYNLAHMNNGVEYDMNEKNNPLVIDYRTKPSVVGTLESMVYSSSVNTDRFLVIRFNTRPIDYRAVSGYLGYINNIINTNSNAVKTATNTTLKSLASISTKADSRALQKPVVLTLNVTVSGLKKTNQITVVRSAEYRCYLNLSNAIDIREIYRDTDFDSISSITVKVDKIDVSFMNVLSNLDNNPDSGALKLNDNIPLYGDNKSMLKKLLAPDGKIVLDSVSLRYCTPELFELRNGYITTEYSNTVQNTWDYMSSINNITTNKSIILSSDRPSNLDWTPYNTWARELGRSENGQRVINTDQKKYVSELQEFIYSSTGVGIFFTFDPTSAGDALIVKQS